ncbi:hypothetical protein G6F61_005565 [Rhizopus arrhizus]|nr:hypothetical protein G6F61_005565 [Rhizopus arrhizus]
MMNAIHEILSSIEVQAFVEHMKRYLNMYMPNAGYEISDTKRYSEKKVEACLIATKDWQRGDEISLLSGIILSPTLFLGPARFANHDCDSNCRFITQGQNTLVFQVRKEIKCGEELTVFYGQHYFGENNCECKCVSCEKNGLGYFTVAHEVQNNPNIQQRRRSKRTMIEEDEGYRKRPRVMSIDFICNNVNNNEHHNLLDLFKKKEQELTIVVNPDLYQSSPPLSTKADSAVGLSPKTDKKLEDEDEDEEDDLLDQFLDDISDLSSIASDLTTETEKEDEQDQNKREKKNGNHRKMKKGNELLDCVACNRPLQNILKQVGPEISLVHELATWTWSPSAVFTDWCPKRCPRCERHFTIFKQEWPNRRWMKMDKEDEKCKQDVKDLIIDLLPIFTTPSDLTPSSEYACSPLSEEIDLENRYFCT